MNIFSKILKIIINILITLIILLGITIIVLFFIGIEPFVVKSGSMEPAIMTGSVCFVDKNVKYNEIKADDIIAFSTGSKSRATHRVVEVTDKGFVTKGDANDQNDTNLVSSREYLGKTVYSIPKVGYIISKIQTTKGKIVCGIGIIILFIFGLLFGDDSKKEKKEKQKNEDKTNEKIEDQKRENQNNKNA